MLNILGRVKDLVYPQRLKSAGEDRESVPMSVCYRHPSQKCNWLCALTREQDHGAVHLNRKTPDRKRIFTDERDDAREAKRRAPLFEYVPGTFRAVEIISDDEDNEPIQKHNICHGRGTRDKPSTLGQDELGKIKALVQTTSSLSQTTTKGETLRLRGFNQPMQIGTVRVTAEGEATCPSNTATSHTAQLQETDKLDRLPSTDGPRELVDFADNQPHSEPVEQRCLSKQPRCRQPPDSWTCEERKRFLLLDPPAWVKNDMQIIFLTMRAMLDPLRHQGECWICPQPGRRKGGIHRELRWKDGENLPHVLHMNYGVIARIHLGLMTKEQLHGFIKHSWHLSHLCGNWTCVNPQHHTVEPGHINVSRNKCFRDVLGPCSHGPDYCLKDLKRCLKEKPLMTAVSAQPDSEPREMHD